MDIKSMFASKTIWGAVAMVAPTILSLFGLTAAESGTVVSSVTAIVSNAFVVGGFVLTIIGRFKANTAISVTGK